MSDSTGKPSSLPATSSGGGAEVSVSVDATTQTATSTVGTHDDVALIHGRTEDGKGLKILRRRKDKLEIGAVVPLEPGKPIAGEVVRLEPRPEMPLLCDVHVEYSPPAEARPTSTGPAQVATDRYRANWDEIFGKKDASPKPVLN